MTEDDQATGAPPALEEEGQRCPNCAPGYDCERGIYVRDDETHPKGIYAADGPAVPK